MNIHHLSSEDRRRTLDIDQVAHILELGDCLLFLGVLTVIATEGVQSHVDISADFIGWGILSDDAQEVQGVGFISFTDQFEEVC